MRIPVIVCMITMLMVVSCQASTTENKTVSTATPTQPATGTEKSTESWKIAWDHALSLARKEKNLTVYTGIDPSTRDDINKAVKNKFGIEIEWIVGRGG